MMPSAAVAARGRTGSRHARLMLLAVMVWVSTAAAPVGLCASAPTATERFHQANEAARTADYPKAIAAYRDLAASGETGAELYWNWAQAAQAQGLRGEAVWALLRARERDPGDVAVARALERLREELNLDPSELAPEPLAQWRRWARWSRVDLVAAGLLLVSVALHALRRPAHRDRGRVASWMCFCLGALLALLWFVGSRARQTAVIVQRGAALFEAASGSAESIGTLREGEVVPVLAVSTGFLRIQDSAGARGWARTNDVALVDDTL